MPEGDSVLRVARRLDAHLRDVTLRSGRFRHPRWATTRLDGHRVLGTLARGKHLLTRLDGDLTLHTHLRMDGEWALLGAGRRLPARLVPDARVELVAQGPDGGPGPSAHALRMPVVELLATSREAEAVGHLGPDVLGDDWDPAEAARRLLADPARPLVTALLDQRNLAGLGALWADELCFLRGHGPWTPVADVDLGPLLALARKMLLFSVSPDGAHQVTTGDTRRGRQHWVVGRAGRPCLRCGTPIRVEAEVPGDPGRRRTWWCPVCQPGPEPPDG